MAYKISRYAYWFKSSKGKNILYCSRTNSLMEISENVFKMLVDIKKGSLDISLVDEKILKNLLKNKIIVEDTADDDFLLELHYKTDKSTFSNTKLGLVIAPTIDCNFSCGYCFEKEKRISCMNDETIDSLIKFIQSHKECRTLDITWYGGEPLMAQDSIEKILDRITVEVDMHIGSHKMLTNGYLFNDKVVHLFTKYPLDILQITLDGNRDRHDNIRKEKYFGKPTYDRIVGNLDLILEYMPKTNVHLRINIDKSNINDYYRAVDELGNRWKDKNILIYPGILRIDNEDGKSLSCKAMSRWEIVEFMYDLSKNGIIDYPIYPHLVCSKTCTASRVNSYIIGPYGEIYKCWNDVSCRDRVVGNIKTGKVTNSNLLHRYIVGSKWYNNESCKKCFFLPICNGQCAWYQYRNKYEGSNFNLCDCMQKAPGMLNKSLEYYVDNHT